MLLAAVVAVAMLRKQAAADAIVSASPESSIGHADPISRPPAVTTSRAAAREQAAYGR